MKLLAESQFNMLSLRRFAVLLELCKADNQPRRLQDKTAKFQLFRSITCTVTIDKKHPLEWFDKTTQN
jgi:hypothetical protein